MALHTVAPHPLTPLVEWLVTAKQFLGPIDGAPGKHQLLEQLDRLHDEVQSDSAARDGASAYLRHLQYLVGQYSAYHQALGTSHIQPLWYRMYLEARGPLLVHWNYALYLTSSCPRRCPTTASRAALLATCALYLRDGIKDGSVFKADAVLPDSCRVDVTRMCPDQFTRLFRCCRIPHHTVDSLYVSDTCDVLLLRRGRMAVMTLHRVPRRGSVPFLAFPPEAGGWITHNAARIAAFVQQADSLPVVYENVAVLTNGDRNRWAAMYEALYRTPCGKDVLRRIANCAFAITLDEGVSRCVSPRRCPHYGWVECFAVHQIVDERRPERPFHQKLCSQLEGGRGAHQDQ